jgi:hypothetical protein
MTRLGLFDAEIERQYGKVEYQFDGETIEAARDNGRLTVQLNEVRRICSNEQWWTLAELARATGYPEASISARLRDLRKPKFGRWNVERQYVERGLFRYRVTR